MDYNASASTQRIDRFASIWHGFCADRTAAASVEYALLATLIGTTMLSALDAINLSDPISVCFGNCKEGHGDSAHCARPRALFPHLKHEIE